MKERTPDPVRDWMPSPTALLNLKIQSGHILPDTYGTNFLFISIVLPIILAGCILNDKRKISVRKL
ncbi:MAG: hypothetical protein ACTSUP_09460 [Candidatus Heimdallarchaeaceae archaeon]